MSVKSSCTFAFYCLYFKLLFYYSIWYSKQTSKTRHGDAINKKQSRVPTAITFVQHCTIFTTSVLAFIFFSPFIKRTEYSKIALFQTYSFADIVVKFSFKSFSKLKTMFSDGKAFSSSDEISCSNSTC